MLSNIMWHIIGDVVVLLTAIELALGKGMPKKIEGKRAPGRPPTVDEGQGAATTLRVRISKVLRSRIGKWSKAQPDEPADSEAARRLLDRGLNHDGF